MQKKRFPIFYQMIVLFGATLLLLVLELGTALYSYSRSSNEFNKISTHTTARVLKIREAQQDFTQAIVDMRGYAAYGDNAYLTKYQENMQNSLATIKIIMPHQQRQIRKRREPSYRRWWKNIRLLPKKPRS